MGRFILLLGLIVQLAFAVPPDLECINVQSFGQAYNSRSTKQIDDPLIVLIGESENSDPKSTWEIWEHPEVLAYIKQREILVTYVDKDTSDQSPFLVFRPDPADVFQSVSIFEYLQPESVPMVVYYPGGRGYGFRLSRDQFPNDPHLVIKWLRDPKWRTKVSQSRDLDLLNRIARNPSDVGARIELIEHRSRSSGRSVQALELVPWLLVENTEWFDFERKMSSHQLSEEQFRRKVFNEIMVARLTLSLFKNSSTRYPSSKFDTWIERVERESTGFWSGVVPFKTGAAWHWGRLLEPYVDSVQSGEGTDRDRFIVYALLAEGEEWKALIQKYSEEQPKD